MYNILQISKLTAFRHPAIVAREISDRRKSYSPATGTGLYTDDTTLADDSTVGVTVTVTGTVSVSVVTLGRTVVDDVTLVSSPFCCVTTYVYVLSRVDVTTVSV